MRRPGPLQVESPSHAAGQAARLERRALDAAADDAAMRRREAGNQVEGEGAERKEAETAEFGPWLLFTEREWEEVSDLKRIAGKEKEGEL